MNKSILGIMVGVISLVVIGGVVLSASRGDDKGDAGPARPSSGMNESSAGTGSKSEEQSSNTVVIDDFRFSPAKITVKKGTTVTWTNNDSARHDIMPTTESSSFMPSDLLAKGQSYSFTFDTPGTYDYICSPHPYMKGTVEVTE